MSVNQKRKQESNNCKQKEEQASKQEEPNKKQHQSILFTPKTLFLHTPHCGRGLTFIDKKKFPKNKSPQRPVKSLNGQKITGDRLS